MTTEQTASVPPRPGVRPGQSGRATLRLPDAGRAPQGRRTRRLRRRPQRHSSHRVRRPVPDQPVSTAADAPRALARPARSSARGLCESPPAVSRGSRGLQVHLVDVAPGPHLSRLRGAGERVPCRFVMSGGVGTRRAVAASHVPAGQTEPQTPSAVPSRLALQAHTAPGCRRRSGTRFRRVRAGAPLRTATVRSHHPARHGRPSSLLIAIAFVTSASHAHGQPDAA